MTARKPSAAKTWPAWLVTYSIAGELRQPVVVVGETRSGLRIRNDGDIRVRLAGPRRYLYPGKTTIVPRYALTPRRVRP